MNALVNSELINARELEDKKNDLFNQFIAGKLGKEASILARRSVASDFQKAQLITAEDFNKIDTIIAKHLDLDRELANHASAKEKLHALKVMAEAELISAEQHARSKAAILNKI